MDQELEQQVLGVLARWDQRLEIANAAWADLPAGEQRRREAEFDAAGETDEWVVALCTPGSFRSGDTDVTAG